MSTQSDGTKVYRVGLWIAVLVALANYFGWNH